MRDVSGFGKAMWGEPACRGKRGEHVLAAKPRLPEGQGDSGQPRQGGRQLRMGRKRASQTRVPPKLAPQRERHFPFLRTTMAYVVATNQELSDGSKE